MSAVPEWRRQGAGVRRGARGWEYGFWMVNDKTDARMFLLKGYARNMQLAMRYMEKL